MIIELSIAAIAVAFIALVIFLITMIKSLRETFYEVNRTLYETRKHIDEIAPQAQKAIEHANQVSFDLKRKMESLNPIFNSLNNVGEMLEHKTYHLKKENLAFSQRERRLIDSDPTTNLRDRHSHREIQLKDILELVDIGFRLWKKFKA